MNRLLPGRAGQREWQLDKLDLTCPRRSSRPAAAGPPARRAAHGAGLQARRWPTAAPCSSGWAPASALRGGKGQLQGQLSWAGSPLTLDYPSLDGQLRLDVDAGPVPARPTRAARGCSACSACSRCRAGCRSTSATCSRKASRSTASTGDVTIARGVAQHQQPAHARRAGHGADGGQRRPRARDAGPARASSCPRSTPARASLADAVINPAIGLGTFLAQWLLREPLIAADTREFHVTGPLGRSAGRSASSATRRAPRRASAGAGRRRAAPPTPAEKRPPR